MTSSRDTRLDSIKGILILLVMFGHCVELTSITGPMRVLYNLIYAVHMPVFVFISGYFTNTKKEVKAYFHDVLNFFLVYWIFQLLKWLCFSREFTADALLAPQWTWWYLLSLSVWRTFYYFMRKFSATSMLVLGLAFALIGGFVPLGTFLSVQRTFVHGAFFAMGYFVAQKNLLGRIRAIPHAVTIPVILIFIAAQVFFYSTDINYILWGRDQYAAWPIPLQYCVPARALWLLFSCGVIIVFLRYFPSSETLQKVGKMTLFLYAYHSFALGPIKAVHPQINDFAILGTAVSSAVIFLCVISKIKFLHDLLAPVDLVKKLYL